VALSEDETILYVVASNSLAKAVFYALYTHTGLEAWRYTASYSLKGISEPVVYGSTVIMGDSRVRLHALAHV
jgi:outer membrane protein assembly factor BamB